MVAPMTGAHHCPMTATDPSGPLGAPPPPPDPSRRLVRLVDQGKVAGVAAGLGWYFGIDPTLFRIAFVVITVAGGLGIPIYIAAALIMPRATTTDVGRPLPRTDGDTRALAIAALAILGGVLLVSGLGGFRGEFTWAVLLIGIGVLLFAKDRDASARPAPPPLPPPPPRAASPAPPPPPAWRSAVNRGRGAGTVTAPVEEEPTNRPVPGPLTGEPLPPPPGGWASPPPWDWRYDDRDSSAYGSYAGDFPEPPHPEPPRERSFLGRLTFAAWLLVVGTAALLDGVGLVELNVLTFLALTLVVIGVGLVVGARFGHARGMIALGFVLVPALAVANMAAGMDLQLPLTAGVGDRRVAPASLADLEPSYELTAGDLHIDLSALELDATDVVELQAGVLMGEVTVVVPPDAELVIEGRAGAGRADLENVTRDGVGLDLSYRSEGAEGAGRVVLELNVGLGHIEVLDGPGATLELEQGALTEPPGAPTARPTPEPPDPPEAPTAPDRPAMPGTGQRGGQ